jgi:hypothetical protein
MTSKGQIDCRTSDQHSESGSGGSTRYDAAGNMTHDATGLNYSDIPIRLRPGEPHRQRWRRSSTQSIFPP